jgi:hypothetical protein
VRSFETVQPSTSFEGGLAALPSYHPEAGGAAAVNVRAAIAAVISLFRPVAIE